MMKMMKMKNVVNRVLSLLLCAAMCAGFACMTSAQTQYHAGDIVSFGAYPQSRVTDAQTVSLLEARLGEWTSYRYTEANPNVFLDGSMHPADYMFYQDLTLDAQRYRAVYFTHYRDVIPGAESSVSNQPINGYEPNNVYYFLYEPIRWRVLDPDAGLLLSETILDAQPITNYVVEVVDDNDPINGGTRCYADPAFTYYANNYICTSMRGWLRTGFAETAFNAPQRAALVPTHIGAGEYSVPTPCADADDELFLLSLQDVTNPAFGFAANRNTADSARSAAYTDYACCQGLYCSGQRATWWLRTAFTDMSSVTCCADDDGSIGADASAKTNFGVRPAMCLRSLDAADPVRTAVWEIAIRNNPGTRSIGYNVRLILAGVGVRDDVTLQWYVNGKLAGEGTKFAFCGRRPYTVTLKALNADGEYLKNEDGGDILDTETVNVRTSFMAKIRFFLYYLIYHRYPSEVQ